MRAQALKDIAVAVDEGGQAILLGLQVEQRAMPGQMRDLLAIQRDLLAYGLLQSLGGNDLQLMRLVAVAGNGAARDGQRAQQHMQRGAHDFVKVVCRADLGAQLGQGAEDVQQLSHGQTHR